MTGDADWPFIFWWQSHETQHVMLRTEGGGGDSFFEAFRERQRRTTAATIGEADEARTSPCRTSAVLGMLSEARLSVS